MSTHLPLVLVFSSVLLTSCATHSVNSDSSTSVPRYTAFERNVATAVFLGLAGVALARHIKKDDDTSLPSDPLEEYRVPPDEI